jgi:hypothetical protein
MTCSLQIDSARHQPPGMVRGARLGCCGGSRSAGRAGEADELGHVERVAAFDQVVLPFEGHLTSRLIADSE